ncbi:MAG: undecaprenyl-diphosphate phosphatase [Lactobacillales bacterium]|jgi:undecaprenyl-diphosphatase|nr:undecaprenyl-diphosphate phosphatase [Lactobacillales bacterium]
MISVFLLALVQSITEFLPVSSSGHLILMEKFGVSHQTLVMDVGLHLGTVVAVIIYFWKDIVSLTEALFKKNESRPLLFKLILATVPIVIVGAVLKDSIETNFRSASLIAVTSILYGMLLWGVDARAPRQKTISKITMMDALLIGVAQVLALVPGTSRSGITMTCARALGIERADAARFSMLLSIPAILLSAVYVFFCAWRDGQLTGIVQTQLYAGIMLSAIFGFVAIWFLMKWVKKASFAVFGIYRVLLGIVLIVLTACGIL